MMISANGYPRRGCQFSLSSTVSLLYVAAAFGGFSACAPAVAQDQHITKTVRAAHDVVLEGYARTNPSCDGIEPPALYLDKPPDHGLVCFRIGDMKLHAAIVGNLTQCLGRKIRGVSVVYLSGSEYTGPDDLRYTVVFPEARHGVFVDLTVLPGRPNSPDAVPADISAPASAAPQSSGPIPACTALVS